MRTMAVLAGLALIFAAGCSDDSGGKTDTGVTPDMGIDGIVTPDQGTDGTPPIPDGSPDQGTDGPGPDLPQGDDAQPDTLPADMAADMAADTVPTPDMGVDSTVVTPDTMSPDTFTGDAGPLAAGKCATAPTVTLVNGTATITDDIAKYTDEFGGVTCPTTSSTTLQDGPQAYYKFQGVQDQWYRFTYNSESSNCLYLYVFTNPACTKSAIEKDCQSDGATGGGFTSSCSATSKRTYYYKANANGMIYVALDDTTAPTGSDGSFTLKIDAIPTPTNGTCANATQLTFFNGKAIATGDTHENMTPDEFPAASCPTTAMDGPQAYYKFTAKANTSYKVKVSLLAGYYVYFYVFGNTCTAAAISADCGSGGATGAYSNGSVSAGNSREIIFTPPAAGTYTIAIDGTLDYYHGNFNLEVEEFVLPTNGKCATPDPINFVNGKAVITGSTIGLTDEFGAAVDCNNFAYDGEQAYYKLTAKAGKAYKMTYAPSFSSYWYVFQSNSCGATTAMNTDCDSGGQTGADFQFVSSSTPETQIFRPLTPGDYTIALDSSSPGTAGAFQLDIEEFDAPTNNTACAGQALTFTNGTATVNGTTQAAPNEFGTTTSTGVTCDASTVYEGNQVYYEFTVDSTKGYTIKLTPQMSDTYVYVFQKGSCASRSAISLDCGLNGWYSGPINSGQTAILSLSPASSGQYVIAVDNSSLPPSGAGDFALEVTETTKPTNDSCATAAPLTLTNGSVTVQSTTGFANDEYSSLACKSAGGPTSSPLAGGQLYWSVTLDATKEYAISATTDFADGYVYVFDGSKACSATNIQTDCQSGGLSGDGKGPISNGTGTIYFQPAATGTYKIAIDSYANYGDVTLAITELGTPPNGSCATASTIALTNNSGSVSGFTVGAADEFPGQIKCGTTTAFGGGQVYHKVSLSAGQQYAFILEADFAAKLYFFRAASACTPAAIDADCASSGTNGGLAEIASANGGGAAIAFKPTAAGDYYLVVDAAAGDSGAYKLSVAPGPEGLVFDEVHPGNSDYMVIKNISSAPISLNGVELRIYENPETFANAHIQFSLPNQVLAPGAKLALVETSSPTGTDVYVGKNILINASTGFTVMLCNGPCSATNAANVLDAARFQSSATSSSTAPALPSVIQFLPGPAVGVDTDTGKSYFRTGLTGISPAFQASDWIVGNSTR